MMDDDRFRALLDAARGEPMQRLVEIIRVSDLLTDRGYITAQGKQTVVLEVFSVFASNHLGVSIWSPPPTTEVNFMVNTGDDRSVTARDIVGSAIVTGDNNRVQLKDIKVAVPSAQDVDIRTEVEALKAALAELQVPEGSKMSRALEDAVEEAAKPEPDKEELGNALERAVKYAKGANDFSEQVVKLAPTLAAVASWLGDKGRILLSLAGLVL